MEIYEYKVIDYALIQPMLGFDPNNIYEKQEAIKRFEAWLNSHGKEGWEFVGKSEETFVFKRRKSG